MRLAPLIVLLAGVLMAGCAGNSVDCAVGSAHGNCAPGTEGHRLMVQQQQYDKNVGEIDDAACRSYAQPGSPAYAECRRQRDADRKFGTPSAAQTAPGAKSN